MEPTPNKDTNINFRVTEQRKLQLQKDAEKKKMTLSDLLNKIIDKHLEPPKSAPQNPITNSETKAIEDLNPIGAMGYIISAILAGIFIIFIFVLNKKREPYYLEVPKNRPEVPM